MDKNLNSSSAESSADTNEVTKNISSSKKHKTLKITALIVVAAILLGSAISFIVSSANHKKALDYTARNVGETIVFGEYDIDKDGKSEELQWVILEKQNDKILVISKYAVDQKTYHNSPNYILWGESALREWLNYDFINSAFSDEQKSKIVKTRNENPNRFADVICNPTTDSVFILDTIEAERYLPILEENRMKFPLKLYFDNTYRCVKYGWSWLRTPGSNDSSAAYLSDGYVGKVFVGDNGKGVCDPTVFVRPVMWISVN